jgi:hypothetical protein
LQEGEDVFVIGDDPAGELDAGRGELAGEEAEVVVLAAQAADEQPLFVIRLVGAGIGSPEEMITSH